MKRSDLVNNNFYEFTGKYGKDIYQYDKLISNHMNIGVKSRNTRDGSLSYAGINADSILEIQPAPHNLNAEDMKKGWVYQLKLQNSKLDKLSLRYLGKGEKEAFVKPRENYTRHIPQKNIIMYYKFFKLDNDDFFEIPVNTILEVRHIEPQSLQHTILEFVINHVLTQTDYDMDKIIKIGELLNINFDKYYEIKNYGRPLNIEEAFENNFGGKKLRKIKNYK
jgi:hypothetical protein